MKGTDGVRRCAWGASTPDYAAYHDDEWGRPVVDDTRLYEKLCLEGLPVRARRGSRSCASARTSGARSKASTPTKVARFGERDIERLLQDAGIVRHRGKIEATIANATRDHASCSASTDRSPRCCGRSSRRAAGARRATFADDPVVDARVEGVFEGAAAARVPLRRADDGLRRDAVVRHRRTTTSSAAPRAPACEAERTRSLRGQCLLDRLGDLVRFGLDHRREACDDLAVAPDEELLEVPADVAGVAFGVGCLA